MFDKSRQNRRGLPPDLRDHLSKRIHLSYILEVISIVKENSQLKQRLYDFILDEDDVVVTNTLWIMTHFSSSDNEWLYKKQNEIINKVLSVKHSSQERLLLSLLYRQPIERPIRVDFLNYCLDEITYQKKNVGTTVLCLKLAYEMCILVPELLNEYCEILNILDISQSPPSLRVARKSIMKAISKTKNGIV